MAIPSNCALCKGVKPGNFQAGVFGLVGPSGAGLETLAVKVLSVICMHVGAWACFVSAFTEWKVECRQTFLYYMMDYFRISLYLY